MRLDIDEFLDELLDENLIDIMISNARHKDGTLKVKIRPVMIKNQCMFQVTEYVGTKVLHNNYEKEALSNEIIRMLREDFKQAQFNSGKGTGTVLSGKNGNMTVNYKKNPKFGGCACDLRVLAHNKTKRYILEEGKPVDFLIDLGVMTVEGKVVKAKYDKFKQINRFLEFIEDIIPQLEKDKDRQQTIIDFGCGKSYLTFAMYYYLKILKGYDIRVIGLDLKEDVIDTCNKLKERYGYDNLNFLVGDIASYKDVDKVDMVVTLHACDTATDYALYKAVTWGAKVILSVPCCQHEANRTIACDELAPVMKYGILKERFAAIATDAIRAEVLTREGYKTQILEFIDMEHTPKNLLIRAVKENGKTSGALASTTQNNLTQMEELLNVDITLEQLFRGDIQ